MELKGKRIAFLGDSITQGCGVRQLPENRYDHVLMREEGLAEVFNYGIGGTRIAHQEKPTGIACFDLNFCGRAHFINTTADLIVVYGGVNDYLHGDAPIGAPNDKTPATFWGALWYLMNHLKTDYPHATKVFITPARCNCDGVSDLSVSRNGCKKNDAMPLLGYVEIIQKRAAEFDIPVLDLYRNLGIDPNQRSDYEKYTVDGLHFNDEGHAIIAHKLAAFLKELPESI